MMALLEIDDLFMRDGRFEELGKFTKTGKHDVRSRVLDLWFDCIELTQDIRTTEEIDIRASWFDTELGHFADFMVKAKLAEKTQGGYRIRGVGERMKWLVELREKRHHVAVLGGNARAKNAKRGDAGQFQPSQDQEEPAANQQEAGPSQPAPAHTPPAPAPAPASGSSPAGIAKPPDGASPAGSAGAGGKPPRRKLPPGATNPLWEAYAEAYMFRYQEPPLRNGKSNGVLAQVLSRLPAAEAPDVLRFYLTHPNRYYVEKGHSLQTFLGDCEKLRTEWATGRRTTQTEAHQADRAAATLNVFGPLIAKSEAEHAAR